METSLTIYEDFYCIIFSIVNRALLMEKHDQNYRAL